MSLASIVLAVGQHEDALAPVAGSNAGRRKHTPFRIPPHLGQLAQDPSNRGLAASLPIGDHKSVDVFEEEPLGLNFPKDSSRVRPQVPLVGGEEPLSGEAVALARDARNDAVNDSTPRLAVEGSQIRPHSRRSHASRFHLARQDFAGEGVPLNAADCARREAKSGQSEFGAAVESAAAGTEGDDVEGTISHTLNPPCHGRPLLRRGY